MDSMEHIRELIRRIAEMWYAIAPYSDINIMGNSFYEGPYTINVTWMCAGETICHSCILLHLDNADEIEYILKLLYSSYTDSLCKWKLKELKNKCEG